MRYHGEILVGNELGEGVFGLRRERPYGNVSCGVSKARRDQLVVKG